MNPLTLLATLFLARTAPKFDVLAQAPENTETEMQVLCLFRTSPRNRLSGALTETDRALKGLLGEIRREDRFAGMLGETLVLTPPVGRLKARRLLIVGLGDSSSFTPERMRLVGRIVVRECDRMGVAHPFFAPTVKDGGVDRFTTGQVSEQFVLGAMDAYRMAAWLEEKDASAGPKVAAITYLAGPKYAPITQAGIDKALGKGR
jgi:hypothetical protein